MKSMLVTARRTAGALATIVIFAGLSHATPIVELGDGAIAVSSLSSGVAARTVSGSAVASQSSNSSNFYTLSMTNWPAAASSNCTLAGDCRTTTKVPEPQSLILVGSGLLSMAGLIRRKLAR